jgi:RNA polymerase sigma-70 factor (ECF subfamily)
MTGNRTLSLQRCLDRFQAGDEAALNDLLNITCERLGQLTRTMLKDYQRLKRWEETDDILQNALVRLCRALRQVAPVSLRDFYRLATLQIRRELIDLARHYYGPEGRGRRHETNAEESSSRASHPRFEQADESLGPSQLALWTEFHQQVNGLPEEEREVFDLVWYQGLSHIEAAEVLNVSARTVKRRWQAACLKLHDVLQGQLPGV